MEPSPTPIKKKSKLKDKSSRIRTSRLSKRSSQKSIVSNVKNLNDANYKTELPFVMAKIMKQLEADKSLNQPQPKFPFTKSDILWLNTTPDKITSYGQFNEIFMDPGLISSFRSKMDLINNRASEDKIYDHISKNLVFEDESHYKTFLINTLKYLPTSRFNSFIQILIEIYPLLKSYIEGGLSEDIVNNLPVFTINYELSELVFKCGLMTKGVNLPIINLIMNRCCFDTSLKLVKNIRSYLNSFENNSKVIAEVLSIIDSCHFSYDRQNALSVILVTRI